MKHPAVPLLLAAIILVACAAQATKTPSIATPQTTVTQIVPETSNLGLFTIQADAYGPVLTISVPPLGGCEEEKPAIRPKVGEVYFQRCMQSDWGKLLTSEAKWTFVIEGKPYKVTGASLAAMIKIFDAWGKQ